MQAESMVSAAHITIVVSIITVVGSGLFVVWQTIRSEARKTRDELTKGLQENTTSIVAINTKLEEWRPMWTWWIGGRKP